MTNWRDHLLSVLEERREAIVEESTDVSFLANDVPLPRSDVQQMMRACLAIVEEAVAGKSTEIRSGFLEAMPDLARSTTWDQCLRGGLPCWGVILGKLIGASKPEHRDQVMVFLSTFMGAWWSDVSKVWLPVAIREGRL